MSGLKQCFVSFYLVIDDLHTAKEVYERTMTCQESLNEFCSNDVLCMLTSKLRDIKKMMNTRTAALWIQYMELVDILSKSINAERTGKWHMYLQAVKECYHLCSIWSLLLYSLHTYTCSSCLLYQKHILNSIVNLKRLSCGEEEWRYWVIEQVLMRSIKTHGGQWGKIWLRISAWHGSLQCENVQL